jgi:uncharacterized protein (DUF302 family)
MKAIESTVAVSPEQAESAIRSALANVGFGVLTEIDVAAVFQSKLGVERPFMKILGACNPHFAHEALEIDPTVSLLLPCNVVVEAVEDGTKISAIDPLELMHGPQFADIAAEAAGKLRAAVARATASLSARTGG